MLANVYKVPVIELIVSKIDGPQPAILLKNELFHKLFLRTLPSFNPIQDGWGANPPPTLPVFPL